MLECWNTGIMVFGEWEKFILERSFLTIEAPDE
jgi:hypothetical protein